MRIGELAAMAGVSPDAIRFYEREGLLPPAARTSSGYRQYGEESVKDLAFIRRAQALGLRLGDIGEILRIARGGVQPCDHVRTTVRERLVEVDRRMAELETLRAALRDTLRRLDQAPGLAPGCRCAAIEATEDAPA